jgi:hypothetical protein
MMRRFRWQWVAPTVVAGSVGLSGLGLAIADAATSHSPVTSFLQKEATQPRLTSPALLHRNGVHRLSTHVGRIARAADVMSSSTLGDGTVVSPPPPSATAAISQSQAWNAFVAYGSPPNIYVLASTPSPTIELAQITKNDSPSGSLSGTLVWVIAYQDIAAYNASIADQGITSNGSTTLKNPDQSTGYLDVFVDANTGRVLYTTAEATYNSN